jgi:hypothetical protein
MEAFMSLNIIDIIEKQLDAERKNRERSSHYPSDILSCRRQLYYKFKQTQQSNPITPGQLLKISCGNSLHDMLHRILKDSGLEIEAEVEFKKYIPGLNYPISGRIDNVFNDGEIKAGIEIKTSFGRGIKQIQDEKKPKIEHVAQVCCYLYFTDISRFYLVYVGRDNAYRCQFILEKQDNRIVIKTSSSESDLPYLYGEDSLSLTESGIIQKLFNVEQSVASQSIPKRDFIAAIKDGEIKDKFQKDNKEYKTKWNCQYCCWESSCWKDIVDKSKGKCFYGEEEV